MKLRKTSQSILILLPHNCVALPHGGATGKVRVTSVLWSGVVDQNIDLVDILGCIYDYSKLLFSYYTLYVNIFSHVYVNACVGKLDCIFILG